MADRRKKPLPCTIHDPELWHPVGTGPSAQAQAVLAIGYCHGCPIEDACLTRALETGEQGIWGGTTEDERRAMLRRGDRRRMDHDEARRQVNRAMASA